MYEFALSTLRQNNTRGIFVHLSFDSILSGNKKNCYKTQKIVRKALVSFHTRNLNLHEPWGRGTEKDFWSGRAECTFIFHPGKSTNSTRCRTRILVSRAEVPNHTQVWPDPNYHNILAFFAAKRIKMLSEPCRIVSSGVSACLLLTPIEKEHYATHKCKTSSPIFTTYHAQIPTHIRKHPINAMNTLEKPLVTNCWPQAGHFLKDLKFNICFDQLVHCDLALRGSPVRCGAERKAPGGSSDAWTPGCRAVVGFIGNGWRIIVDVICDVTTWFCDAVSMTSWLSETTSISSPSSMASSLWPRLDESEPSSLCARSRDWSASSPPEPASCACSEPLSSPSPSVDFRWSFLCFILLFWNHVLTCREKQKITTVKMLSHPGDSYHFVSKPGVFSTQLREFFCLHNQTQTCKIWAKASQSDPLIWTSTIERSKTVSMSSMQKTCTIRKKKNKKTAQFEKKKQKTCTIRKKKTKKLHNERDIDQDYRQKERCTISSLLSKTTTLSLWWFLSTKTCRSLPQWKGQRKRTATTVQGWRIPFPVLHETERIQNRAENFVAKKIIIKWMKVTRVWSTGNYPHPPSVLHVCLLFSHFFPKEDQYNFKWIS